MRPWERESDTPSPDSPPPKPRACLSSLVVRPPPESAGCDADEQGGNLDVDAKVPRESEVQHEAGRRYRNELSLSPPRRGGLRRFDDDSGLDHPEDPDSYHRDDNTGGSDDSMFQDVSPPIYHRGRGKRKLRVVSPPYGRGRGCRRFRSRSPILGPGRGGRRFHSRSPIPGPRRGGGRFRETPYGRGRGRGGERFQGFSAAYDHEEDGERFLDISPTYEQERFGGRFRDIPATFARGRDTRDARRFRDHSPVIGREKNRGRYLDNSAPCEHDRDARLFERDFDEMEDELLSFRDGDVIRNDPDMARTGDWLCTNPFCRNMNLVHREYCFNCDKPRYGAGQGTSRGSRQKVARDMDVSVDLGPRRENGYRSPPHGWARDVPREPRDFPVPRRGGRFSDSFIPRDGGENGDSSTYRTVGRFDRFLRRVRDPRGPSRGSNGLVNEGRRLYREPWIQEPRERSQSPRRFQPPPKLFARGSFLGRGRGHRSGRGR